MYWETQTSYTLWQGKRLVGKAEQLTIPIRTVGLCHKWTAAYFPIKGHAQTEYFPEYMACKTWLERQLRAEMPDVKP